MHESEYFGVALPFIGLVCFFSKKSRHGLATSMTHFACLTPAGYSNVAIFQIENSVGELAYVRN